MFLRFEKKGKTLIINMSGELDHHSAESVRIKVDNKIDEYGIANIIFNFGEINFMDSSGIGVVIGRYRKVSEYGGKVAVVNMQPHIKRVFELGGLFKIIKEYESVKEAAADF